MNNPNPNPNPLPIYVDQNAIENGPRAVLCTGDGEAVAWETICHGQRGRRFVWVRHLVFRRTSRHTSEYRARPWLVSIYRTGRGWSYGETASATFAGALKLAKRLAVEGGR